MRKMLMGVLAAAALCVVAGQAAAQTYRLSWDQCDPQVTNKAFTTAGIYKLVVSGIGFTSVEGYQMEFDIGAVAGGASIDALPNAWHFESAGCNAGQFSMTTSARVELALNA